MRRPGAGPPPKPLSGHEVRRALVDCLGEPGGGSGRPPLAARLAGRDLAPLLVAARRHRVEGFLWLAVAGTELAETPAGRALAAARQAALVGHVTTLADLRAAGDVLSAAGVPWVVFKGPVLAAAVYSRPDLRSYGDLDLLVPRRHFARAVEALTAAGGELLDRNWDLVSADRRGQLHLRLRHGTPADLHWHLVTRGGPRSTLAVPVDDVLGRARAALLGGVPVRTFDAEDGLLHLCLHAGLGGADVLLLLKDVERWLAVQRPSWDDVVHRAHAWRAAALVGLVLHRARDAVAADVPEPILSDLLGRGSLRLLAAATGSLWPATDPRRPPPAVSLGLRSLREDWRTSAGALVGAVREHGRRRSAWTGDEAADAAVLVPSQRTATRESFLRWVAAGRPD